MSDWICKGARFVSGTQKGVVEGPYGSRPGETDASLKGWWWVRVDGSGVALKSSRQLTQEGAEEEKKPQPKAAPAKKAAASDAFVPTFDATGKTLKPGVRVRVKGAGCGLIDAAYGQKPGDSDPTLRELGMWWVVMDKGGHGLKVGTDLTRIKDVQGGRPACLPRGECPCGGKLKPRVKEGFKVGCSGCTRSSLEKTEHGYWYCPLKSCDYSACTDCCKGAPVKQGQKRTGDGALIVSKRGKTQEEVLHEQEVAQFKGSGWVEYQCGVTMRRYYHNGATGETTWTPPGIPNIATGSGADDPNQPPPPSEAPPDSALVVPGAMKPDLQTADIPEKVEYRMGQIQRALSDLMLVPGEAVDGNLLQKALNLCGGITTLFVQDGVMPPGKYWPPPGRLPELLHGLCRPCLGAFGTLPVLFVARKDTSKYGNMMTGGYASGPGSYFSVLFVAGRPVAEDSGERPNGEPLPNGRECPCNRVLGNASAVLDLHWQAAKRRRRMQEDAQDQGA
eukprot:TRINITY_DN22750_c0_g1_i1.p1 TRINITY_DN22750_c0_g1~~TRINITY_DN22750_c0_g1_i1.p1  ORF type:complete len:542 (+),score=119.92 TRINITY_DN22750_c0_g1_i1:113-1627(+)